MRSLRIEPNARQAAAVVSTGLVAVVATASWAGPPVNDDCADAIPVVAGTVSGSTTTATVDGDASCGTSSATPDVWYSYTAKSDVILTASTCHPDTDYDTAISAHTGCPGDLTNEIACADDDLNCPLSTLRSKLVLNLAQGETVQLRVSGFNTSTGNFTLDLSEQDPTCTDLEGGDTCDTAVVVTSGCYAGSTAGATNDGDASCSITDESPDRWYQCTPDVDGDLVVSTCNPLFFYDTTLAVYSGCPGDTTTELACNDDNCLLNLRQSGLRLPVTAGQTYWIRVTGFNGEAGDYELNIACPEMDDPLTLETSGVCPGDVTLNVSNGTAGAPIAFAYDVETGTFPIPGGSCAGTELELAGIGVILIDVVNADASGAASVSGLLPPAVCDGILQAVDLVTCEPSNSSLFP